ncbi:uncharacterized protein An01g05720 [Aspergillus niger]|uniref:Contig An01c0200, genomic contig n=2 Tax=Aspergillus niger TaxID=5061 RepID=A2Q8V7_ASPNC|nr:uncharacterized protein An01g05720 [Aspergillus niger]CAK43740.1 unnamed protein product [Aspergillus niger]
MRTRRKFENRLYNDPRISSVKINYCFWLYHFEFDGNVKTLPDTPAESGDVCVNAKSIFDDWCLIPLDTLEKKADKASLAYQIVEDVCTWKSLAGQHVCAPVQLKSVSAGNRHAPTVEARQVNT